MKELLTAEDDFLKQISGLPLQYERRKKGSASQGIKILLKVLLIGLLVKLVAESLNGRSCYFFINDKWILDHFLEEKNTQKRNEEQKETQDSIKKQ